MIIGDFNVEANTSAMSLFSDTDNLKNLIKEPTCYKNPNKPSCIDKPRSFNQPIRILINLLASTNREVSNILVYSKKLV